MKRYGEAVFGTVTDAAPVVQTIHGAVRGENREGVAVFRGIPYGGDVSGKNRFRPPSPAKDWEGVRDCTLNGFIAVQAGTSISGTADFGNYFSGGHPEKFGCEREKQGENCLVLNVLTPGIDGQKRPVAVYIHGGGFDTGSGTLVLGADQWVREEDLVLVGINHRLNVFGYLNLSAYDSDYSSSGMAGILDLLLALEWVRNNIREFGGDPEKVTIMGESGGGAKVNHLLAMHAARGLFRAAIVESGSGAPAVVSPKAACGRTKMLLEELGIPEDCWKRLFEIPAEQLLRAGGRIGMGFSPSSDGLYLPYNKEGDFWEADPGRPLLVGAAADELAAFFDPEVLTWEELRARLLDGNKGTAFPEHLEAKGKGGKNGMPERSEKEGKFSDILQNFSRNADEVIRIFREKDPSADPYQIFIRICSQCSFLGAGAYRQAEAKARKKEGPVYNYYFAFQAPHPRCPEKTFAWHTADLPLQMRVVTYPGCEEISRVMAHAWAAFIRTGSPNTEMLDWPPFTLEKKEVMVFDKTSRVMTDPTKEYRQFIRE